jgi:hypothetical protein
VHDKLGSFLQFGLPGFYGKVYVRTYVPEGDILEGSNDKVGINRV